MNDSQVFMLVFMQNVLNFLVLYFFTIRYSRIVNDMNVHFEKTTNLFLDHLSDMYEYGSDYWWNTRSYRDDESVTSEGEDGEEQDGEDGEESDGEEQECEECDGEESDGEEQDGEECGDFTQTTCSLPSSYPQEEELFAQNCN